MSSLVKVMRSPVGRPHKIANATELWNKFLEYCDYIDENPWQIKSASNSINDGGKDKKNAMRQEVNVRQRAYTLYGFCAFAGIFSKWGDFKRTNIDREGFSDVIFAIENAICAQQVDGAMINQFDGSLVARLNGFADKQVTELQGSAKFEFPKLTEEDIAQIKEINGLR